MSRLMKSLTGALVLTLGLGGVAFAQQEEQEREERLERERARAAMKLMPGVQITRLDRDEVRDLQEALQRRGLYQGPINGRVNVETVAAIGALQYAEALPVNGQITPKLSEELDVRISRVERLRGVEAREGVSLTALEPAQIRQVQRELRQRGLYEGDVTGEVDDELIQSVRQFQRRQGLDVTGRIDTRTARALDLDVAEIQPVRGVEERQQEQMQRREY